MSKEQIALKTIKANIKKLPIEDVDAINELAEFFRQNIKAAGHTVGPYAIALVGAEMAADIAGI